MKIRPAIESDHDDIWWIIRDVLSKGGTYAFYPDSDRDKMLSFWCAPEKHTYVALIENEIVGTFFLKQNQPDLGGHVVNAGFMTSPHHSGKGIGKEMGIFAMSEAKRFGYTAMQFNMVIKSNEPAVRLWKKLGFEIVGEIPDAYDHPDHGLTNAYIMWSKL